jgi:hypothetical protein
MKNRFIILILFFSIILPSYAKDSYLNLDKLKKITEKKENVKKTDFITRKIKQQIPIINPIGINKKITQNNKKEEPPFIKPEFLGMIMNQSYKAVLLKYKEQYLYLKEGESDLQTKIKIIKIKKDKLILDIDKKKVELEVDDE